MKYLCLVLVVSLFCTISFAEVCEGINSCSELYTKFTNEKVAFDDHFSDDMSLAVNDTDLTAQNAKEAFLLFLNKNGVNFLKGRLSAVRAGEYLTAPIYVVSPNNMPQMINKDGLMSMVYRSKNDTKKLVTPKLLGMLSRKNPKNPGRIVDFKGSKVIIVSDTFEVATKVMNDVMKADK